MVIANQPFLSFLILFLAVIAHDGGIFLNILYLYDSIDDNSISVNIRAFGNEDF